MESPTPIDVLSGLEPNRELVHEDATVWRLASAFNLESFPEAYDSIVTWAFRDVARAHFRRYCEDFLATLVRDYKGNPIVTEALVDPLTLLPSAAMIRGLRRWSGHLTDEDRECWTPQKHAFNFIWNLTYSMGENQFNPLWEAPKGSQSIEYGNEWRVAFENREADSTEMQLLEGAKMVLGAWIEEWFTRSPIAFEVMWGQKPEVKNDDNESSQDPTDADAEEMSGEASGVKKKDKVDGDVGSETVPDAPSSSASDDIPLIELQGKKRKASDSVAAGSSSGEINASGVWMDDPDAEIAQRPMKKKFRKSFPKKSLVERGEAFTAAGMARAAHAPRVRRT